MLYYRGIMKMDIKENKGNPHNDDDSSCEPLDKVVTRLAGIKSNHVLLYQQILNQLEILYKYRVLRAIRNQQVRGGDFSKKLGKLTYNQLEALKKWNRQIKIEIYSPTYNLLDIEQRNKLKAVIRGKVK